MKVTYPRFSLVLCLLLLLLASCDLFPGDATGPTASQATPASTFNVWAQAAPGIQIRTEKWKSASGDEDIVTIARLDLSHVHISVGYQPDNPLTMSEWMQQTHALALINGGYFLANNTSAALVVANGQSYGTSYGLSGGMLSVDKQGNVSLRSLGIQPYNAATEQLQQATQSWPMLMINGKRTQLDTDASSRRRSVIATDKQGHLLLIVSPGQAFSLDELADQLATSDLDIQNALNLDGGASTGLYVDGTNQKVTVDAYTALPLVIEVK